MNSLFVIQPYKHAGTWVFDDARVGLVAEPFVAGIPGETRDERREARSEKSQLQVSSLASRLSLLVWVRAEALEAYS